MTDFAKYKQGGIKKLNSFKFSEILHLLVCGIIPDHGTFPLICKKSTNGNG